LKNRSNGQMLILAILILGILVVAIPAIIFINKTLLQHGAISQKRMKGRTVAEEGIAFGIQQLTQFWPYLSSNWPYAGGPQVGIPAAATLTSAEGSLYTVTYTSTTVSTTTLQSYQVQIQAQPLDSQGNIIPAGGVTAYVSQRTVGAKLASGLAAPAALMLLSTPTFNAGGNIFSPTGPIVVFDSNTWTLDYTSDISRTPRKFSQGQIVHCSTSTNVLCGNFNYDRSTDNSDQKEYWSYTSLGFPPVIDTNTYAAYATSTTVPAPTCLGGTFSPDPACTPGIACGYFNTTTDCPGGVGDTIVFSAGFGPGITPFAGVPAVPPVIYVNGNAEFDDIAINVAPTGAVVVDGNLTLGTPGAGSATTTPIAIPPTANFENAYSTCTFFPTAGFTHSMHLQGFLYVTGGLSSIAAATYSWYFNGALRVDGPFTLANSLWIYYDDVMNHNIRTSNFEIQIDSTTSLSPH
jgi:hypothetical protein